MAQIKTKHARWLRNTYMKLKVNSIVKTTETTSFWFDRKTIEEALADQPYGGALVKVTGLRFYMGSHDDVPSGKEYQNTLIIVSTCKSATSERQDILENPNAIAEKPTVKDLSISIMGKTPEQKDEFDDAHLCPPDCSGTSL